MLRAYVYTHNAQAGIEQLMCIGGENLEELDETIETIKEVSEIMFDVDEFLFTFDRFPVRLITLTPAKLSSDGAIALLEELRPLFMTLQPDQSVQL